MTAAGIIQKYNIMNPNQVDDVIKLSWLNDIEHQIWIEVLATHDGSQDLAYTLAGEYALGDEYVVGDTLYSDGVEEGSAPEEIQMDTEMILKPPYEDIYVYYIDTKIAYMNGDNRRYNMASELFNNAYISYQQYYNRTHKPNRNRGRYLRHEVL